ncbi:MAG: hypothetical protein V2B15_03500, partial [Bacteroidota bacterium]
ASADPFTIVYQGATEWETDGMRGDGLHVIEPDKVGELGYAYLRFYEITGDNKYLEAAIHCADALAKQIQINPADKSPFSAIKFSQSPWPFRVNARNGSIISDYCSNVLEPVKLLDELVRIAGLTKLSADKTELYRKASAAAWEWLYSKSGPMTTFVWNGYFEDIPNDPERSNRVQITPIELAKYLIGHHEKDVHVRTNVPSLIHWVANAFKTEGLDAIKEQTWCYEPMGSHTARYGSACAMYFELTGDPWYKDQAYRFLNVASYMTYNDGVVAVGPGWPGSWFSDGYSDYIRHFLDAMAAVPEWAPAGEDHLLRSSSVVQSVGYGPAQITITTFDPEGEMVFRLAEKPKSILAGGENLIMSGGIKENSWSWSPLKIGGILRLRYDSGNCLILNKRQS